MESGSKARLLTGDTPTGRLHLGHYVGSIENRLRLQDQYDCFFLIANKHAFTTRAGSPQEIRQSVIDVAMDWLAVGIDPERSSMVIQSEVPAIDELTFFFSMLLPLNRVLRNPTLKAEIRDKELGENHSFGFPLYAVGQTADILAFRAQVVPVGEDQLPHLEMTREVARRFNQLYCGVSAAGGAEPEAFFPVVTPILGRVKRLVGIGGPGGDGQLQKMSKSLGNAIYLSDSADEVRRKVMNMYTDPKRIRATDPGTVENNPVWIFHDAFNPDRTWIQEYQERYKHGKVADTEIKRKLIEVLNDFLGPIRSRRAQFERRPSEVMDALQSGTRRAIEITEQTLDRAKGFMGQRFFSRNMDLRR